MWIKKSTVRFAHISFHFISFQLFVLTNWKMLIIKVIEILSILRPMKNDVRFEYVPWKNVWFCFISMVWVMAWELNMFHGKISDFVSFLSFRFTLVIKLTNFDFEGHWNILILFDKKDMLSDLSTSNGKMPDFVSFPLFGS